MGELTLCNTHVKMSVVFILYCRLNFVLILVEFKKLSQNLAPKFPSRLQTIVYCVLFKFSRCHWNASTSANHQKRIRQLYRTVVLTQPLVSVVEQFLNMKKMVSFSETFCITVHVTKMVALKDSKIVLCPEQISNTICTILYQILYYNKYQILYYNNMCHCVTGYSCFYTFMPYKHIGRNAGPWSSMKPQIVAASLV